MKASLTDVILERFANELPDEFNRGKDSPQDRPRLVTYGKTQSCHFNNANYEL